MSRNHRFRHIKYLWNREVITDANVLIYVYWPDINPDAGEVCEQYGEAFFRLQNQGTRLVVTMGVLLEVSAVVFNERWKSWNRDRRKLGLSVESDYKLFRDSVQGRAIMDDINEIINGEILKQLEVVGEKCFSNIEALTFFVAERIDLPDKLIAAVAVDCGYIVFTHDSDFLHTAVDILTANGKILRVIR